MIPKDCPDRRYEVLGIRSGALSLHQIGQVDVNGLALLIEGRAESERGINAEVLDCGLARFHGYSPFSITDSEVASD
jgi:hypothetical protein